MALEDMELKVGGVNLRGVYIVITLSFASTIAGGIWTASEFMNRLEQQEEAVVKAVAIADGLEERFNKLREQQEASIKAFEITVSGVTQSLEDNNVSELQGKLAELGTNLTAIMEAQKELLDLRDRISAVEKSNSETVLQVSNKIESLESIDQRAKRLQKEIDDIWNAMDALANPLG